jgi:hypothetical protein
MQLVAGILDIISGTLTLIGGLILILTGGISYAIISKSIDVGEEFLMLVPVIFIVIASSIIVIGILAIIGGIFALRNKIWGLALAGSIAAIIPLWPLGIAAIVFTALSKNEFE